MNGSKQSIEGIAGFLKTGPLDPKTGAKMHVHARRLKCSILPWLYRNININIIGLYTISTTWAFYNIAIDDMQIVNNVNSCAVFFKNFLPSFQPVATCFIHETVCFYFVDLKIWLGVKLVPIKCPTFFLEWYVCFNFPLYINRLGTLPL